MRGVNFWPVRWLAVACLLGFGAVAGADMCPEFVWQASWGKTVKARSADAVCMELLPYNGFNYSHTEYTSGTTARCWGQFRDNPDAPVADTQITVRRYEEMIPFEKDCEPGVTRTVGGSGPIPLGELDSCQQGCAWEMHGMGSVQVGEDWAFVIISSGVACEGSDSFPWEATDDNEEGCRESNGITFCAKPTNAPNETCGTFNGKMVCATGSDAPSDTKPPPSGCITKGDITMCASEAPDSAPPRPATEKGGSQPKPPAGSLNDRSGSPVVDVIRDGHQGGYDSGSGLPPGEGMPGDDDGDGECSEGETCSGPKVEVKQEKDWFNSPEAREARTSAMDMEHEHLKDLIDTAKEKGSRLLGIGGLPEGAGTLPDFSWSATLFGETIAVDWNLARYQEELNTFALLMSFLFMLAAVAILLGD